MKEEPLIWGLPTLAGMRADLSSGLGSVAHQCYHPGVRAGLVVVGSPNQNCGWSLLPHLDFHGWESGSPLNLSGRALGKGRREEV